MSFEASNSVYSIGDLSDDIGSVNKESSHDSKLSDSSGSSISLSDIPSQSDKSEPNEPSESDELNGSSESKELPSLNDSVSAETESIKSIWSISDVSGENDKQRQQAEFSVSRSGKGRVLPSEGGAFVYDGRVVRYNVERGVDYKTPLVVGSRKLVGDEDDPGYRASHLVFDPRSGTLAAGRDLDNKWCDLPKYSLITGVGNSSHADASFVSGSYNKIEVSEDSEASEEECDKSSSCAIIGSSGVTLRDCEETVALGVKRSKKSTYFSGFKEATITSNLYGLKKIYAGPLHSKTTPDSVVLDVNGDALIRGNLSAANIAQKDVYVAGSGVTGTIVTHVLTRGDGVNVVYVNPINGPVHIQLGTSEDPYFEPNRVIVVKDVTPEFNIGASHNVGIYVPVTWNEIPTRIEHYTNCTGGTCITASTGGTYSLNSSGGAVTLRYMTLPIPGSYPTWVIESQLIGNPRLLTSTGVTFIPASEFKRQHVLRR
jgi:hypothetical protein